MTDTPSSPISFETADPPADTRCTFCGRPLAHEYFTVNGQIACGDCPRLIAEQHGGRAGAAGVARAIGLGSAAGLVGAIVWWAIRHFASLEIGLIAIGIGHVVGLGVRRGSGGRGGRGFQVLAVALTYFWITANYVPDIVQAVLSHDETQAVGQASSGASADAGAASSAPATPATESSEATAPSAASVLLAVTFLFGVAMASPFLEGAGNIIGILIISFGLWQAWKLNAALSIAVAGPFRLRAATPPPVPTLPPPVPGV